MNEKFANEKGVFTSTKHFQKLIKYNNQHNYFINIY